MTWLFMLRNPIGRLISSLFSLGLLAVLWFTVGHGIVDSIKNDTALQGGGGPQSQRTVSEKKFGPIVDALRKKVGSDVQLLSVTLRPTSVEFVVRDGKNAKGYRSDHNSTSLDSIPVNLSGPGTVAENAFPIAKLDRGAPQRIAAAISRKESGDFNLSIGTLERQASGKLLWSVDGTISGRGVGYTAQPNGGRVKLLDPTSPEISGVPPAVTNIQDCIRNANNDPQKLQACARGVGG